jgi:hypothetical protein
VHGLGEPYPRGQAQVVVRASRATSAYAPHALLLCTVSRPRPVHVRFSIALALHSPRVSQSQIVNVEGEQAVRIAHASP